MVSPLDKEATWSNAGCSYCSAYALGFTQLWAGVTLVGPQVNTGQFPMHRGSQTTTGKPEIPPGLWRTLDVPSSAICSKKEGVFRTSLLSYHPDSAQKFVKNCHIFIDSQKNDLSTDSDNRPPALLIQRSKILHPVQKCFCL